MPGTLLRARGEYDDIDRNGIYVFEKIVDDGDGDIWVRVQGVDNGFRPTLFETLNIFEAAEHVCKSN